MSYIEGVAREQQVLFPEVLDEYVAAENPHVRVVSVHPGGVMTDMGHKAKAAGFEIPADDSERPPPLPSRESPGRRTALTEAW